jgi:hypothetical protein
VAQDRGISDAEPLGSVTTVQWLPKCGPRPLRGLVL